ncbi:MAG: M20 family metallopeptidase, partial [Candidatus Thorarchaeota archaeon]
MIDDKRMFNLLKELIATNSENPPGFEKDVAKVIQDHMESYGMSCSSIGPSDRPNLVFSTHDGEKGPLVLHGHMDTVPIGDRDTWSYEPFGGEIVNGRMYGRGTCDMKGPVTSIAETMIQYKEEGHKTPLLMLCTSDEESGCSGAEAVAADGILEGVSFGICAEPTSLNVLVGEKGILWSKVIAKGKSAHGSRPEEGINAINLCMTALQALSQHEYDFEQNELLGNMTFSIGMINGGIKVNVVAAECEAVLDMRTVKGQTKESIFKEMNHVLQDIGLADKISIEYIHGKPAVVTPMDAEIVPVTLDAVQKVTGTRCEPAAATYGTDCSVLQPKVGIINVICGPGSIEQAHQPDEYIT